MALSRLKTWIAEILSVSDLNAEFDNILTNGEDLGTPATKAHDMDRFELVLDEDGDTSVRADTDDRIDFKLSGANLFRLDGTVTTPVNGLDIIGSATGSATRIDLGGGGGSSDSNLGLEIRPAGTGNIRVRSTDTGTAATGNLELFHNKTSGAVDADVINELRFIGNDDAGTPAENTYGTVTGKIIDSGAGSEDGEVIIRTSVAGSLANRIHVGDGLYTTGATGGDQGANSINATSLLESGTRVGLVGKQTIWVPAKIMHQTVTDGADVFSAFETTARRPDIQSLDFKSANDDHAQFSIAFPKSWNLGTITYQVFWSHITAVTTGVAWGLSGVAFADAGNIDDASSFGTIVVVEDDAQNVAEELLVTDESGAVTIAGTPGDDELCFFEIVRDVSNNNDDMTQDALLIGIKLFITTDTGNDA